MEDGEGLRQRRERRLVRDVWGGREGGEKKEEGGRRGRAIST